MTEIDFIKQKTKRNLLKCEEVEGQRRNRMVFLSNPPEVFIRHFLTILRRQEAFFISKRKESKRRRE